MYRPFKTIDEFKSELLNHKPYGWVKEKEGRLWKNMAETIIGENQFKDLFNRYIFLDNVPFGIKEK